MRLLPEPAAPLPTFASLLVHGPYPPSAPVHLALSVPPPEHALLFTPDRGSFLRAIQADDDPWLRTHAATGAVAAMSSRATLFYPPSPKHLIAVLAMLRVHRVAAPIPVVPDVTLDRAPVLLVLHEPSAYFAGGHEEYTLSDYLLLITHALATVEYLSSRSLVVSTASLVVFDTGLGHLKLPVFKAPPENAFGEQDNTEDAPKPESVLFLAEKYFELSGTFHPYKEIRRGPQIPDFVFHRTRNGLVADGC